MQGTSEAASVMPWIAALGIVVSLVWNFFNMRHTNDVANQIRIENRKLERWDRVRNRIATNLEAFTAEVISAPSIIAKAPDNVKPQKVIELLELEIAVRQDALAKALEEADRSDCCSGTNWVHLADGPAIYDGETSWDMILTVINAASRAGDHKREHLKRLKTFANDIDKSVRDALEREDRALTPKPLSKYSIWTGWTTTE